MDWSVVLDFARTSWARAKQFTDTYPEIAVAGLVLAGLLALWMVFVLIRSLFRSFAAMRRAARSASIRKSGEVGARILIARGRNGRQRALCRFMTDALDQHLKKFMFGGPFQVLTFPDAVGGVARAEALLARTEADLIIWADTPKGLPKGKHGAVCISSRSTNPSEPARASQTLVMPRKRSEWSQALSKGMAYAVAKQYRPALGRPQDFRAERLMPVVEILLQIMEQKPKADPRLMAEIVDDTSSGALQMAVSGEVDWLDRAVEFTRTTLDGINRGVAPDRWIAAKVNLGRALRLRAERRFDPVVLREATAHLQEALEALRSESRFRLAESAAQAIADAQKLLSGRRKFSITGGGV
jgi:hypothetical protein